MALLHAARMPVGYGSRSGMNAACQALSTNTAPLAVTL
jgi:hypothetical protein